MKNKKTNKKQTVILCIVIIAIMIMFAYGFLITENEKYPIIADKIKDSDTNYIYNFYVSKNPSLNNRMYLGEENASLTIIIFSDTKCESCKIFIDEIYPIIESDYINTGKVKFYHKNNLVVNDYNEKNEKFQYAQSLMCVKYLAKDKYWNYYFNSYNISTDPNLEIYDQEEINKYNISRQDFEECMTKYQFKTLLEDMSEVRSFGIESISPVIYIGINNRDYTIINGIPSINRFKRLIKQKQIIVGD